MVNNPPAVQESQETQDRSLGWEDLLEEGMTTHSSILAWRSPWTEEPGELCWTHLELLSTHHKLGLEEREEACRVIAERGWDPEEWGRGRDSKKWEPC